MIIAYVNEDVALTFMNYLMGKLEQGNIVAESLWESDLRWPRRLLFLPEGTREDTAVRLIIPSHHRS